MDEDQLLIAFDCDIWRSSSSMRLIGVFNIIPLEEYFYKHYREFEKNDGEGGKFTRKEAKAITFQDLLDQKVNCLHVDTVIVNEPV